MKLFLSLILAVTAFSASASSEELRCRLYKTEDVIDFKAIGRPDYVALISAESKKGKRIVRLYQTIDPAGEITTQLIEKIKFKKSSSPIFSNPKTKTTWQNKKYSADNGDHSFSLINPKIKKDDEILTWDELLNTVDGVDIAMTITGLEIKDSPTRIDGVCEFQYK